MYSADTAVDALIDEMSRSEIQYSVAKLVSKLPSVVRSLESGEEIFEYFRSAILDESTLSRTVEVLHEYMDGLDSVFQKWEPEFKKISTFLTPANVQTLLLLLDELLKSSESILSMLKIAKNLHESGLLELASNVNSVLNVERVDKSKQWLTMAKSAREQAKSDDSVVSIFGLYKMLKDPSVQEGLKTLNALLKIVSTQEKN